MSEVADSILDMLQNATDEMARLNAEITRLRARIVDLEGQHKGLVITNGILRQRDDLPVDRLPVMREVETLRAENERLRSALIRISEMDGTKTANMDVLMRIIAWETLNRPDQGRTAMSDIVETLHEHAAPVVSPDLNDPVGTLWRPYDVKRDFEHHPRGKTRVAVMLRNSEVLRPDRADFRDWDDIGTRTIVAWRYAKEGE